MCNRWKHKVVNDTVNDIPNDAQRKKHANLGKLARVKSNNSKSENPLGLVCHAHKIIFYRAFVARDGFWWVVDKMSGRERLRRIDHCITLACIIYLAYLLAYDATYP